MCAILNFGLLGLRVLIPAGAWMSIPCECCVSERRTDHLSIGVRRNVACPVSVITKSRKGRL